MPTRRRDHDAGAGLAVLDVGVEAVGLQARDLAETEIRAAIKEMVAATGAHPARRVAEQLDDALACLVVVGIDHDQRTAVATDSGEAGDIDDVGIWIALGPFFDDR